MRWFKTCLIMTLFITKIKWLISKTKACSQQFKINFDDNLPDKCKFYSPLKDKCVSEKDYLHVINVWNAFEMKTMGDYHDHYLKTDIL